MAARTDQKWSAALIRRMARLADREMSTAQIAKALGLTRGQVLGKMHRLGLKTKNPPRKWLNTALGIRPYLAGRESLLGHLRQLFNQSCQVLSHDQRIALDGAPAETVDAEAKDLATKQLVRLAARKAAKKAAEAAAPAVVKPKPAPGPPTEAAGLLSMAQG